VWRQAASGEPELAFFPPEGDGQVLAFHPLPDGSHLAFQPGQEEYAIAHRPGAAPDWLAAEAKGVDSDARPDERVVGENVCEQARAHYESCVLEFCETDPEHGFCSQLPFSDDGEEIDCTGSFEAAAQEMLEMSCEEWLAPLR
jgi:hypothetical protein